MCSKGEIMIQMLFWLATAMQPIKFNEVTPEICCQDPSVVVELTAGEKIPLQFWIKGDLLSLDTGENKMPTVVVQKTFYVKYVNETYLFSTDQLNWKQWFDFVTGSFGITIPKEEGESNLVFYLEADER